MHGVGFAIKNEILRKLPESPIGVNERLMTIRVSLINNSHATLISAYAPTLNATEEDKDRFYQNLDEILHKVPRKDKIVLLGDFNARVGKDSDIWDRIIGKHGVGKMNANGLRLLTLCAAHDLTITNTVFQQKDKYKTSWMHPRSKHWHLIDYVIVRRKDLKDVLHTRAMRGADCWTDHRLIRSKLRLTVRPPIRRQRSGKKKLNINKLRSENGRNILRSTIANAISEKQPMNDMTIPLDDIWEAFSTLIYDAAEEALGIQAKKHKDWFDENMDNILPLLDNMHKMHSAALNNPNSPVLKQRWQNARAEVQRTTRNLENEWWTRKGKEIQTYADSHDMHNFYDAVKRLYGPRNRTFTPVKTSDGATLLTDQKQIVNRWSEHFKELLNQANPIDETVLQEFEARPIMNDLDQAPSFYELMRAVKSLKDNKSPGPDSIPAEILKQGGYLLLKELYQYILEVWDKECVPQQWKDANIITIYKNKGERSLCGNSRGISLLSVAGKILSKILLQRLSTKITEDLLPESQCGFRRDRGTVDMIFTVRQLQEKAREQNRDLHMAFIDLTKAFDSVNREFLWEVLRISGCPPKFVNLIRQFHEGMRARVTMAGEESEPFDVATGVKQGCVKAPVLFNLYILCVTTLLHRSLQERSGINISFRLDGSLFNIRRFQSRTKVSLDHVLELQYADDCALVADSPEALQAALTTIAEAYTRLGLTINISKTEVLSQWSADIPPEPPVQRINGEGLATVPSFKYLGSYLSCNTSLEEEIQHRLRQAAASFGRLRTRVFKNDNLTIHTKMTVYNSVCISTLLYACETWTAYRRNIKPLEAFHIRCLQNILGITWQDRIPHTTIFERTNSISIEATIAKHHLRWVGHVIRMPENRLPRRIMYSQLHEGRRKAGGPKLRYKDQLKKTLKRCDIEPKSLEQLANNREDWRRHIHIGVGVLESDRRNHQQEKRARRHARRAEPQHPPAHYYQCGDCGRQCASRIGLYSHRRTHR